MHIVLFLTLLSTGDKHREDKQGNANILSRIDDPSV